MLDGELHALETFDRRWALVTAGTPEDFNTMTVSWGGLGTIWHKSVVTIYVKPIRYTHEYLDRNEYFTVSFFPEKYRQDLLLLGTKSGRDGDKVAETALTPVPAGNSVSFAQAEVTLVCRKIYRQEMQRSTMPADVVQSYYTEEEPHTMYIGEVVARLDGEAFG